MEALSETRFEVRLAPAPTKAPTPDISRFPFMASAAMAAGISLALIIPPFPAAAPNRTAMKISAGLPSYARAELLPYDPDAGRLSSAVVQAPARLSAEEIERMPPPTAQPAEALKVEPRDCPACRSALTSGEQGRLPDGARPVGVLADGSPIISVDNGSVCDDGFVYRVDNHTRVRFGAVQVIGDNGQAWKLDIAPDATAEIKSPRPIGHFDILLP